MAFFTASYQHILWTPTHQGLKPHSAWCGFSYHLSSITTPTGTETVLTSVLTELYNSSTPTRSPTRSLEWHDWSSSSGNNCHAVRRSLSSGASVYECIMGFTLSHFISQIHPRDFFRLLAIGMCHFLPVHHFVMACLIWPKVKIQHLFSVPPPDMYDTRPFLRWVRSQGNKPTPHKGVKTWGAPWGRRKWWVKKPALGQIRVWVKHGWPRLRRTHHRDEYSPGINNKRKNSLQSAGWVP